MPGRQARYRPAACWPRGGPSRGGHRTPRGIPRQCLAVSTGPRKPACLLPGPGQAHGEGLLTGGERRPGRKRLPLPLRGCLRLLLPFTGLGQQVDLTRGGCSQAMRRSWPPTLETPIPAPAWSAALLSPPTELHASRLTGEGWHLAWHLACLQQGCPGGQEGRAPALHPVARPSSDRAGGLIQGHPDPHSPKGLLAHAASKLLAEGDLTSLSQWASWLLSEVFLASWFVHSLTHSLVHLSTESLAGKEGGPQGFRNEPCWKTGSEPGRLGAQG